MSTSNLLNLKAVQISTPLPQVYVVAMNHDSVVKALGNVKDSVFACVRSHAAKVYERHINLAKKDFAGDLDGDALSVHCDGKAMRAEFKHLLDVAEAEYKGDVDKKAKSTWNKNKTDLGRALLLRYPFIEAGQKGSSAICTWCTNEEDRIEEEVNATALQEQAKKEGKDHLSITKSKTEDVTVDSTGDNNKGVDTPAGSTAVASTTGIKFATPEQEAAFNKMIESMAGISQTDPDELDGVINGANNQLELKKAKLLRTVTKLAATG